MRGISKGSHTLVAGLLAGLLLTQSHGTFAQSPPDGETTGHPDSGQGTDPAAIGHVLQELQSELHDLKGQVRELKIQQLSAQAESAELRKELEESKAQLAALANSSTSAAPEHPVSTPSTQQAPGADRLTKLEEDQQMADAKIAEQSQTKVESASKYRVRLSGIMLFNTFGERGHVDNSDFPQMAVPADALSSGGSFGASVRQSQIGLQAFGPAIAGAHTSADIQFDFAGGFPETENGASFGIMRLRTATVRFDWTDTSVIGGQDSLFFAPLSPTSIATLAIPALAYSGNLWSWTPQIRLEHRFTLSGNSVVSLQGGILDNFTGDVPPSSYNRYPSWGEYSGQPGYATRLAWTKRVDGEDLTIGAGGYYSRQLWGFGRSVDGWAGTFDLKLPLGKMFEFTSQFYRGRALGGIGGGLGQSAVWDGPLSDPATEVYGLNSMGGWAQLKYRATPKLQFNAAVGQDNPFASDLRNFEGSETNYGELFSRNQSVLANFIFQPRSDFVFSLEYRRLKTTILDNNSNSANVVNLSVGYIF